MYKKERKKEREPEKNTVTQQEVNKTVSKPEERHQNVIKIKPEFSPELKSIPKYPYHRNAVHHRIWILRQH